MLIAPATASTIGKMANGIADNMLITTYLSAKAPVFVAPAMDLDMYAHPATQKNLEILRSYGNHIIEPGTGELASHLVGKMCIRDRKYYFERIKGAWILEAINLRPIERDENEDFVEFFGHFATDSLFQSQRVREPLAFVTTDPDDDFSVLETTRCV